MIFPVLPCSAMFSSHAVRFFHFFLLSRRLRPCICCLSLEISASQSVMVKECLVHHSGPLSVLLRIVSTSAGEQPRLSARVRKVERMRFTSRCRSSDLVHLRRPFRPRICRRISMTDWRCHLEMRNSGLKPSLNEFLGLLRYELLISSVVSTMKAVRFSR